MKINEIKKQLKAIKFVSKEGEVNIYERQGIEVNIETLEIKWLEEIKINDKKVLKLKRDEDWVVLECVCRLLDIGYSPSKIIIEKNYPLGKKDKGKLDILLLDEDEKAYAMIECKTIKTYEKTWDNMCKIDGDRQLLSYFLQDREAKILVLYTYDFSKIDSDPEVKFINVSPEMKNAKNIYECFNAWGCNCYSFLLFWKRPYETDFDKKLLRKDLKPLNEKTATELFNRFAIILRKHAVSDKSNAYNKLFNLILCKIIDEDKPENCELKFQYEQSESDVNFLKKLNDLYREGMSRFLEKEITDISDQELDKLLINTGALNGILRKKIDELRLYKNNEFAFIEVYNEESFNQNTRIVKDVVKLLEHYQVRYAHKQQYLGNFFEKLLNTGFKQENGQFFTPIPVTKFILKSLPILEFIKNNQDLPYVIDYACGSGHFLTEAMDEIQSNIKLIKTDDMNTSIKNKFENWKRTGQEFSWANEYIYGIDNDYRLVKTTKIACFLNGDGEANIIHANGLDSFGSKDYKKKLERKGQFDIVIANPPYSVEGFLGQINKKDEFKLYKDVRDNTDDIECFFIERTHQILKENGIAALILPTSILTNPGIHDAARRIMLVDFEILGLVYMGTNTFMETGTTAVTVFLRKRKEEDIEFIKEIIEKFLENPKDLTCNGIENAFSTYVKNTKEIGFEEYKLKLKELKKDQNLFQEEKEKLLIFMLSYQVILPIFDSGKGVEKNREFLGYQFSTRKGSEGITFLNEGETPLEKTAKYIKKSYLNELSEEITLDEKLKEFGFITRLSNQINWEMEKCWRSLRISKKQDQFKTEWEIISLGKYESMIKIEKGTSITEKKAKAGEVKVIAGGIDFAYYHNIANRTPNVITVSASGANAGFVNYWSEAIFASDCTTIQCTQIEDTYFIYIILKLFNQEYLFKTAIRQAQSHIGKEDLKILKVPFPPAEIRKKIYIECNEVGEKLKQSKQIIKENTERKKREIAEFIENIIPIDNIKLNNHNFFDDIIIGKRIIKNQELLKNSGYPILSANVFEPFGFSEDLLKGVESFEKSSIVWGIDGDWMVRHIEKNDPFIPTDHCGVLRVKNITDINSYYVALLLEYLGEKTKFSRQNRASKERVASLSIPIVGIEEQNILVNKIKKLEEEINKAKKTMKKSNEEFFRILKKYKIENKNL